MSFNLTRQTNEPSDRLKSMSTYTTERARTYFCRCDNNNDGNAGIIIVIIIITKPASRNAVSRLYLLVCLSVSPLLDYQSLLTFR